MASMNRRFDAVLFDLDGTLLDTLEDLCDSMNAVLAARGHPTHPLEAYRYFVGDGIAKLVWRTLPEEARDEETVAEAVEEMRTAYRERWNVKSRPYEGVPELLATLRRAELRLVVLSNKPDAFTRLCVEELLDPREFEIVRGALDGVPCKPDPAGAIAIAEELGVAPERFLYLGDTNTDMKTARGAGMYPVGAAWGFRPVEELVESGAEVVIERPSDLVEVLGLS